MASDYKKLTKSTAIETEGLRNTAKKVLQAQFAMEQALMHGELDPINYEWFFILIEDASHELVKRLDELSKKLFAVVKSDMQS